MYWPTTTARRLHLSPAGLHKSSSSSTSAGDDGSRTQQIVDMGRSRNGHLWAAISADTLSIWNSRPTHVVAALVRTPYSLQEYGDNTRVQWTEDGMGLVIETDKSYLLLYTIVLASDKSSSIFSYIPSSGAESKSKTTKEPLAPSTSSLRSTFAAGPGEGTGAMSNELKGVVGAGGTQAAGEGRQIALDIRFKLLLRIDARLSCTETTREHLIVATKSPPAVQCIPWPDKPSEQASSRTRTSLLARLQWIIPAQLKAADEEEQQAEDVYIRRILHSRGMNVYVWLTSDGRAYCANLEIDSRTSIWRGRCFHGAPRRRRASSSALHRSTTFSTDPSSITSEDGDGEREATFSSLGLSQDEHAVCASINAKFSLIALGLQSGLVVIYTYRAPDKAALFSHSLSIRKALRSTASYLTTGPCTTLSWTSDGHGLAVGWQNGWSVWSTYGKLMGCSLTENWQESSPTFSDIYMKGVQELFWGPGNTELFLLANASQREEPFDADLQLFALPFAKSAVAGQHSPDNTRYAFIQLDDSVLVYRGSDQPDMSIINPESDVWHHIRIPQSYLAANWPIRYACISGDGRLIAIAGRRGVTHFSTLSGRWKQYTNHADEQNFTVRGGLQWYQHVLVVACHIHSTQSYELRLYSRDANLDDAGILYREQLPSAVVLTSLFDNSLLVYTADNTLYHYLIAITPYEIRLTICGSITFEGVVGEPARVRGMSWLIPSSQQQFGDPMDDLTVATVIFLIDGKLVLLRPRRGHEDEEEVSYDMQILGDQIEYYWTHLQGIGTLENSLWGYDGRGIKLWLDALTIEQAERREEDSVYHKEQDDEEEAEDRPEYKTIEESVSLPLDFYPLCVLIEKGIIIGVEPEVSMRKSLDFAIFRSTTNTQLFLQHVLRKYLEKQQLREAVVFSSFYTTLVYFSHALEILLHDVLEDEADLLDGAMSASTSNGSMIEHQAMTPSHSDVSLAASLNASEVVAEDHSRIVGLNSSNGNGATSSPAILPIVVAFLDHFDESLEVVVNCARKTEVARWKYLFSIVGDPRDLFEICLQSGNYKTAGSYLLVLHNVETLEESKEYTIRLLKLAKEHGWTNLCKDLLRFTRSLDDDGRALRDVVKRSGLLLAPSEEGTGLLSPMGYGPNMLLHRTSSAPNVLDSTPEEEEEGNESMSPSRPAVGHRSMSLFTSNKTDAPPVPQLSVNGRIIPSNASTPNGSFRSSSAHSRRSPSITSISSSGLGMSLSRVGLRSSDRLWDQSQSFTE